MSFANRVSPQVETFQKDGRASIQDLYAAYEQFVSQYHWNERVVFSHEIPLPTLCFTTPQQGPALWILTGVHGEEPAGPNAIARNVEYIAQLGEKIPIVLFPLCNPMGYLRDWRYINEPRDWKKGQSVSDAEYLLLDPEKPTAARKEKSSSPESLALTSMVLKLMQNYPPLFSIDHHEDEALSESYVYSQGKKGINDPIAQKVVALLEQETPIQKEGTTRFGEKVENGIIGPVRDGSIDELLSAEKIILHGEVSAGPATPTVLVIETPVIGVPLEKRIAAHEKVIRVYSELFTTH